MSLMHSQLSVLEKRTGLISLILFKAHRFKYIKYFPNNQIPTFCFSNTWCHCSSRRISHCVRVVNLNWKKKTTNL